MAMNSASGCQDGQRGNLIDNANTQYIKASVQTGSPMTVKVTKGGDLRAK